MNKLGGSKMNIINQYEKDGYIFIEYDNGTIVKEIKQINNYDKVILPLSESEVAMLDTSVYVEYLVCLSDLNI